MSYENKVVIIHNLKDFDAGRTARHGTYNLQEKLDELDEVYRKAQAFDQLAHTYQQYKESHTHDLKSTMGTKAIELLEADE